MYNEGSFFNMLQAARRKFLSLSLKVSTITGICGPLSHKHPVLISAALLETQSTLKLCKKGGSQLDALKIIPRCC